MKRIAIIIAVLLCSVAYGQESQRQRLEKHLYTLASDSLRGRETGTVDAAQAARYITRQWDEMGVKSRTEIAFGGNSAASLYHDYYFIIEGNDPMLKDEYIVVGAHYDHLGVKGGKVYNGADDNASGTACLIEIARQLMANRDKLKRSVIICAFDAEEKGLLGSKEHVRYLRDGGLLDKVKLMMSVDMVGWYKVNGELVMDGTGTIADRETLLSPEKLGVDIKVRNKPFENSLFTATDTEPYASAGIPTIAVTTGIKSPYHKPEDDANLIDYEGLDRIVDYLAAVTIAASRQEGELASGRLAAKHHTKAFDVGLLVGYNICNMQFPDAVFEGKGYYGFQGGMSMQYNFGKYASLRANVLYDYSHCPLPAADDAYGKGYNMEQHSLLVPVTLQFGYREMGMGIYVGVGGYYGRALKGCFYGDVPAGNPAYRVNSNQGGIVWNFGMRLGGHWQFEGTWYYQMGRLFDTSGGLPKARMSIYAVTLGYYF